MNIHLEQIPERSRHILENLFTYYVYDMSEFADLKPDLNGRYSYLPANLADYWHKENHIPYFIFADGQLTGFILIEHYPPHQTFFDIDQFFVLRKFKGQGIGKKAFQTLVNQHPGKWQIRVLKENKAALAFWLSAVRSVANEDFQHQLDIDIDLEMHFIRFEYKTSLVYER